MNENKNGYEIRFGLLKLSRDILSENTNMAREDKIKTRNQYFSTEDVIKEAEKLYCFVKNKY